MSGDYEELQKKYPLPSATNRLSADVIDGLGQAIARHYRAHGNLRDSFAEGQFDDTVDDFLWFAITTFAIRDWLKKRLP